MPVKPLEPNNMNPPLKPILVTDAAGLRELGKWLSTINEFGYDIETNVTNRFFTRKIRTMQFGNRDIQFCVDLLSFAGSKAELEKQGHYKAPEWVEPVLRTVQPFLESKEHLKVGVNLDFEYIQGRWCLGLLTNHFYDCLVAEKIIHAGKIRFDAKEFWGMEDMLARYAELQIDKTLQKSFDLETPLTQEQIVYSVLDTRIPFAIRAGQKQHLTGALPNIVELECNAIPSFGDMHLHGMPLVPEKWKSVEDDNKRQHVENIKALDRFFIPVVGDRVSARPTHNLEHIEAKWRNEKDKVKRKEYQKEFYTARRVVKEYDDASEAFEGDAAINYGSHTQLLRAFRQMGYGEKKLPNTNAGTVKKMGGEPVFTSLTAYRKTEILLSTFGESYLEYIDADTGRIHPNIHQIGAETGRPSCTKPNLYNIPAKDIFRSCFIPRPGYKYITIDMSGAELRIMAENSGEESWIEAFERGWDVHSLGAEMMYGEVWHAQTELGCKYASEHKQCSCAGHKLLRKKAKAINFGVAYGKEHYSLAEELEISNEEAKKLLAIWRKKFTKLYAYLVRLGESAKHKLASFTVLGRRRQFDKPDYDKARQRAYEYAAKEGKTADTVTSDKINRVFSQMWGSIEREGKNAPIQGGNADIAKLAMALMWHDLHYKYDSYLINHVYDEVNIEAPDHLAQEVADFCGECIREAGRAVMKRVTMEYEYTITDCWRK